MTTFAVVDKYTTDIRIRVHTQHLGMDVSNYEPV